VAAAPAREGGVPAAAVGCVQHTGPPAPCTGAGPNGRSAACGAAGSPGRGPAAAATGAAAAAATGAAAAAATRPAAGAGGGRGACPARYTV